MRLYICIRVPADLGETLLERSKSLWRDFPVQWFGASDTLCKIAALDLPDDTSDDDLRPIRGTMVRMCTAVRAFELHFHQFRVTDKNQICVLSKRDESFERHFTRLVTVCKKTLPNVEYKLDPGNQLRLPYLPIGQMYGTWRQLILPPPRGASLTPPLNLEKELILPVHTLSLCYVEEDHSVCDLFTATLKKSGKPGDAHPS